MKSFKMFVIVCVLIALLVANVAPALAASSDAPCATCKYGYVYARNPKTLVITTRCKTYSEWLAERLRYGMSTATSQAQQWAQKQGRQFIEPLNSRPVQNSKCLLSGGTNCYK
jgi:hypothetical protein